MRDDQLQRSLEQRFPRFDPMPRAGSAGMRQGNEIELVSGSIESEFATDQVGQRCRREELRDGELSDGDDQFRLEKRYFRIEPGGAVGNLHGVGNSIAASFGFAGKTATNCCHVNGCAELFLCHSASALEPSE